MIIPLGHRLLVKPEKIEDVDPIFAAAARAGIEIAGDERKREQNAVDRGTVISIGTTAYQDFGGIPWCSVGDIVGYSRYGGKTIKDPVDNVEYIVLNDEDVVCRYAVKESNE